MKKLLYLFLVIPLVLFGQDNHILIFDGINREYLVYTPESYDSSLDYPVLFNFHGGSGYANDFIYTNDMRPIADTAGFIAVYPQGAIDPDGGTTSWIHKAPTDHDDIYFVEAIIDALSLDYSIDQNRIYACGYSEGAILSYELGCRLNDKIAAFAAVSGSMLEDYYRNDIYGWGPCSPVHPTGMMLIPGTVDQNPHSTYEGLSYGDMPLYMSANDITNYWSNYNNTDINPVVTDVVNSAPNDGSTVEKKLWLNGDNCVSVQELRVVNGDHDWPGSFGNMDINASEEIWNFVSQFNLEGQIECNYIIEGCTNETASNYVDYATEDDGSCEWLDCDGGISYTSLNILIEDSVCHSNLYCEDYNWDGGDCVFDCNNDLMTIWDIDSYFYNGQCDQILNCMAYNFDNESCTQAQGCEDENGISYDHGVQWSIDLCMLCSCENGEISCFATDCEVPECEAPNYLQDVQGQCCPVCIDVEEEINCIIQNIPIELNVGWGIFGYTCLEPQNVIDAFSSITADIIILKDYLGNAYLPEWDFNGIGSLEFARGYQIKMNQTVESFQFCATPSITQVSGQEQIDELQLQLDEALIMISSLEQEITNNQIQIGDIFAGGIVFQINENGTGLVAALDDIIEGATDPYGFGWSGYEWGCFDENTDGANGTSISTGHQNSLDIASQCLTENGGTTSAQETLAYESQTYNDWYLPSKEELVEMYMTIGQGSSNGNIGGFINEFYWSSTENDDFKAWGVNFGYGFIFNTDKNLTARVRAIRAF